MERLGDDPRKDAFHDGDGLRGYAALAVVICHVTFVAGGTEPGGNGWSVQDVLGPLFGPSLALQTGLYVFLALSGYLIGARFLQAWVLDRPMPKVKPYASRRIRRIVPLFWLSALLTLLLTGTKGSSFTEIAAVFAFAQVYVPSAFDYSIGQAWTLDVEVVYYLLLPLLAVVLVRVPMRDSTPATRAGLLIAPMLLLALVSVYFHGADPSATAARTLPLLFWGFVPGLVLGALQPLVADKLRGSQAGRPLAWGLLAVAALSFLVTCTSETPASDTWRSGMQLVCAGSLLSASLVHQWTTGAGWSVYTNAFARAMGRWSYGIYLLHVLVLNLVVADIANGGRPQFIAAVLLTFAITVPIAAFLWKYFEKPFLQGSTPWARFTHRNPAHPAPMVATIAAPGAAAGSVSTE